MLYKVIAKTLANRLQSALPDLVGLSQSALVGPPNLVGFYGYNLPCSSISKVLLEVGCFTLSIDEN